MESQFHLLRQITYDSHAHCIFSSFRGVALLPYPSTRKVTYPRPIFIVLLIRRCGFFYGLLRFLLQEILINCYNHTFILLPNIAPTVKMAPFIHYISPPKLHKISVTCNSCLFKYLFINFNDFEKNTFDINVLEI